MPSVRRRPRPSRGCRRRTGTSRRGARFRLTPASDEGDASSATGDAAQAPACRSTAAAVTPPSVVPGNAAGVPADEAVQARRDRDPLEERAVVAAVDGELGDASCPRRRPARRSCVSGIGRPGLRAEHELAALDEEDPGPAAAAGIDEGDDDGAEDVVGVAVLGDDAGRPPRARRLRSHVGALELPTCRRKLSGIGSGSSVVVVDQHVRSGSRSTISCSSSPAPSLYAANS